MASSKRPAEAISPRNAEPYFQHFEYPWSGRGAAPTREPTSHPPPPEFDDSPYSLILVQEPRLWRASNMASLAVGNGVKAENGKTGKKCSAKKDTNNYLEPPVALEWLSNDSVCAVVDPHVICVATVQSLDPEHPAKIDTLTGGTSSSLQKLKRAQGDQSIFAFPTLGIRYPGRYMLKFAVYRVHEGVVLDEASGGKLRVPYTEMIAETYGSELIISTDKSAAYAKLSTQFTKNMRESGVKVRTRKEPRKRKSATTNWTADCFASNFPGAFPLAPTYMALPGHNGPMPNLNNGEDISRRMSYQGMTSSASLHTQPQYTTAATTYLLPTMQQNTDGYVENWTPNNTFIESPGVYHNGVNHNTVTPNGLSRNAVAPNTISHNSSSYHNAAYHNGVNHDGVNHSGVARNGFNHSGVSHSAVNSNVANRNGVNNSGVNRNDVDNNDVGNNNVNNYQPGWRP
ncbi:hypothetical protein RBB50_003707 [Rhinocladiella similis]